jgi:type I restriction enzyme, S subunit
LKDKTHQWNRVLIKDVCELILDCVNKTAPTVEKPTPYKMIRTTNVKAGSIYLTNVKYVTKETYDEWTQRAVPRKGDVILTREAPLGEVGILRINDTIFLGQRLIQYRTDPEKLNNYFLLYAFQAYDLQAQIKSFGSGAIVEHMRVPDAKKLMILLPDLRLQRKIASVLFNYDNFIENNTLRIEILEQMAKLIYEEWFVKFRFPDHENVKMTSSELGEIPEAWKVKTLGEFGEIIIGKTPSTKNKENYGDYIPFIKIPDMDGNLFCISSSQFLSKRGERSQKSKTLLKNTLLVSCIGTIGAVSITSRESQINQQINALRPFESEKLEYLYFELKKLKAHLENLGANGVTLANVNKEKFQSIKVADPEKNIAKAFHEIVSPIFSQIKTLQFKNQNLCKTRALLLPKLISGKTDISDLDIQIRDDFEVF